MEGISLDNVMSSDELERLLGTQEAAAEEQPDNTKEEKPAEKQDNDSKAAEVVFSDLLGEHPESVGSGEDTEGNREKTKSQDDDGAPNTNLFSSIAEVLRDKGFFPDLSDEKTKEITDEEALMKLFEDKVSSMLDDKQRLIDKALSGGASSQEAQEYQKVLSVVQFLEDKNTYDTLLKEGDDGEKLRKQVMYQDYVNRGFSPERAEKMVEKSVADGMDIEDAKEAFASCKDFYRGKADGLQKEFEDRKKQIKDDEEKQYSNLKKKILDTETFYDGVKVDKSVRQQAYDLITKPTYRDDQGNYMTALQKYQKENPMEFMENVALMYALTDGFKNVDRLAKGKVKEGLKKGFAQLENVLNNSRRNGDGTLNLANGSPDESEREKWTLAI